MCTVRRRMQDGGQALLHPLRQLVLFANQFPNGVEHVAPTASAPPHVSRHAHAAAAAAPQGPNDRLSEQQHAWIAALRAVDVRAEVLRVVEPAAKGAKGKKQPRGC